MDRRPACVPPPRPRLNEPAARVIRLYFWQDRMLYLGPPVDGGCHAHHAVQLVLALDGPLRLRADEQASWMEGRAFAIAADAPHQLHGGGGRIALLFLDPESAGTARLPSIAAGLVPLDLPAELAVRIAALPPQGDCAGAAAAAQDWLAQLLPQAQAQATARDARIEQALAQLREDPARRWPVAAAAQLAGLSPGRFMHLFRTHTGLPLRRYLLWLRLRRAMAAAMAGASLTGAAHDAGFSDSAHLTRSFRSMFGLAPAFLFERRAALKVSLCAIS